MPVIVTSTRDAVGETNVVGDGCIDPAILDGQAYGRSQYRADGQTMLDAQAFIIASGRARNLCIVMIAFALAYLGLAVWTFVFASSGRSIELFSEDVGTFDEPQPVVDHSWPLPWILASYLLVVSVIYLLTALIGGQSYLAAQIYARAELVTGPVAFWLHATFIGAAVLLLTDWRYRTSFYALSFGVAIAVTLGYFMIGNSTAQDRGWSFTTIIGFVVATLFNVIQWLLLVYTIIAEDLDAWIVWATVLYILFGLGYWLNVLMWTAAVGSYDGGKTPRARYDIFAIVAITLLMLQALAFQLLYNLNELD